MLDIDKIYQFNFPTVIRMGVNVIEELPAYLKKEGIDKPLLVTDKTIANLPFFHRIRKSLEKQALYPEIFDDMHKNPVKSDVLKGGEAYDQSHRNGIVAVGGGVAIDVARAIALRIHHRRDLFDYDDLIGGDQYVTEAVPPFIAVPTTAGTGSEVGRSAIISEDESKKKRILFSPKLMAQIVFADPVLTQDLPPFITAATGMDALTHNMEAYLAKNYHPMCDGIALEGMKLISQSIVQATHEPNLQARFQMLLGSLMGAVAFQKGLGVVHSLAHPLSSLLDTHHGLANAVNLPYGMEFNYAGQEQRFEAMAQAMGISSGKNIVPYLFELNQKLNLPEKLSALGVESTHIDTLAQLAYEDFAHPNNPIPVSQADFKKLYTQAL